MVSSRCCWATTPTSTSQNGQWSGMIGAIGQQHLIGLRFTIHGRLAVTNPVSSKCLDYYIHQLQPVLPMARDDGSCGPKKSGEHQTGKGCCRVYSSFILHVRPDPVCGYMEVKSLLWIMHFVHRNVASLFHLLPHHCVTAEGSLLSGNVGRPESVAFWQACGWAALFYPFSRPLFLILSL